MTHDKPLVPPGADTSTAEDAPQPEDQSTATAKSAAATPEATSLSLDKEPAPEPKASPGITFAGTAGTAPIHTQETDETEAAAPLQDASTTSNISDRSKSSPPLPPVKPGIAENSFRVMSFLAPLFLAVLLLLQTAAGIYFPSLYLPSEVATAGIAAQTTHFGLWLTPAMVEQTAMLPGYFWFLGGLKVLLDMAEGVFPALGSLPAGSILFSLAACIAAFVTLAGTYALGKATGLGRGAAFAAGLMLLSSLGFVPLAHFVSPDLLQAGIMAFALACLYKGWTKNLSFAWLALGFLLTGLSALLGGLPGLLIPLVASLLFLCWRGTLRRGHRLDAVLGFGLMLLAVLGWLGAVILLTEESPYMQSLVQQLLLPLTPPLWPPQDPWWLIGALLCLALAPWVLVVLFVSWGRVLSGAWTSLKTSRTESSGTAWLWICLVFGLLLLTINTIKPWLAVVPLLPPAALLLAKALLRLPPGRSRLFFLLTAAGFLLLAIALGVCSIPPALEALSAYLPAPLPAALKAAEGLPVLAVTCAAAAMVLWKLTNRAYPGGALTVTVLLVTILIQPATLMLSPSLNGVVGERIEIVFDTQSPPIPTSETFKTPEATPAPPLTPAEPQTTPPKMATPPIAPAVPEKTTPAPKDETIPAVPSGQSAPVSPAPGEESLSTAPDAQQNAPQQESAPVSEPTAPHTPAAPEQDVPAAETPAPETPPAPSAPQPIAPENKPSASATEPRPAP